MDYLGKVKWSKIQMKEDIYMKILLNESVEVLLK